MQMKGRERKGRKKIYDKYKNQINSKDTQPHVTNPPAVTTREIKNILLVVI